MILVTQGHELGIGLEVFFKAYNKLESNFNNYTLYAFKESIQKTASSLDMDFEYFDDYILINSKKLNVIFLKEKTFPQSTIALENALKDIDMNSDILFTLPTSKDQLINSDQKICHGYTEFLRNRYQTKNLTMSFLSPKHSVSLVTDHIPLNKVSSTITKELISNKVKNSIETISKIRKIKNIIVAGINPHSGEGGLLGHEDDIVDQAIRDIKKSFPQLNILGPVPGDTMHFHYKNENDLLVYMYHDQGLAPFKFINGLIGINITCGLPFIRVSVDHGTSFNLYGKNLANESGCLYLMEEISRF